MPCSYVPSVSSVDAPLVGRVHSTYMGGMVDGPGIRYVLFLAGCRLRCLYCHNPDTWDINAGKLISVDDIVRDVEKYRSYLRFSSGGVTVTGGEPLMQAEFLAALLSACHEKGWHTVLQTSGYMARRDWDAGAARDILSYTDLVLLDIKAFDDTIHKHVTGVSPRRVHEFLHLCETMRKRVIVRFVLVPGLTDNAADVCNMAAFLRGFSCVEKVEVQPFHKTGEYKWADLGLSYELGEVQPPTVAEVKRVQEVFERSTFSSI